MKHILLVEDDAIVSKVITRVLGGGEYRIDTAADGQEGLERFTTLAPDLLITDLIMPKMEGLDLIRQVRARWPEARILAISGGARIGNANYLNRAVEAGADRALAKPFRAEALLEAVEACLARGKDQ